MKVLLISSGSPARDRLARAMSELPEIRVQILEPSNVEVEMALLRLTTDVVLIDVDQSCGRGLEIIRGIRGKRDEEGPVIMAVAGSASIQYRASCLEAGAMYFFNLAREHDWLLESLASLREQVG